MIMDDKAYFIEDGKTYYAKRTLSNQKCGFVTLLELSDYTIANSKLFYHDQFNRSRNYLFFLFIYLFIYLFYFNNIFNNY